MWQKGLGGFNYLLMIHRDARPICGKNRQYSIWWSPYYPYKKSPQVETDSDTPLSIQHRLEILRPPTLVRTYWIEVLEIKHENKRHPSRKQQYITIYCWWKMSKTTLRSWSVMEVYAPPPSRTKFHQMLPFVKYDMLNILGQTRTIIICICRASSLPGQW